MDFYSVASSRPFAHGQYVFLPMVVPTKSPSAKFTARSRNSLKVSWGSLQGLLRRFGKLKEYRICYSFRDNRENEKCKNIEASATSYTIKNLYPSTKYFVTVAAGTSAGFGRKSEEISKITNGGKLYVLFKLYFTPDL